MDNLKELQEVLDISVAGIRTIITSVDIVERLRESGIRPDGFDDLSRAREEAALARREVDNDFPLLHAQTSLLIWSSVEHMVLGYVADLIGNAAPSDLPQEVRRIRFKVGDYVDTAEEERPWMLLRALQQEVGAPVKIGAGRFEALLGPFGLSGPIPDPIRQTLYELQHVRNVHAHRRGRADRIFIDACPWMGVRIGQSVKVGRGNIRRYFAAAHGYVGVVIQRARVANGLPHDDVIARALESYTEACEWRGAGLEPPEDSQPVV